MNEVHSNIGKRTVNSILTPRGHYFSGIFATSFPGSFLLRLFPPMCYGGGGGGTCFFGVLRGGGCRKNLKIL